jgi:hypothetical protein
MSSFDLSKVALKDKKLLVRDEVITKGKKLVSKKAVEKKSTKSGRPMVEDEPLNIPITVNFTQTEIDKIKKEAGDVAVAKFLRGIVRNAVVLS